MGAALGKPPAEEEAPPFPLQDLPVDVLQKILGLLPLRTRSGRAAGLRGAGKGNQEPAAGRASRALSRSSSPCRRRVAFLSACRALWALEPAALRLDELSISLPDARRARSWAAFLAGRAARLGRLSMTVRACEKVCAWVQALACLFAASRFPTQAQPPMPAAARRRLHVWPPPWL